MICSVVVLSKVGNKPAENITALLITKPRLLSDGALFICCHQFVYLFPEVQEHSLHIAVIASHSSTGERGGLMLANVIKQTVLVGIMLTISFMVSAETKPFYGQDRLKIRTVISESNMRQKASIYGNIMMPDGDEQVAIRDFRMLKQWHDMYVEETLPDRKAYKKSASDLLKLYGKTSGWGYQDYVVARHEFAMTSPAADTMVWEEQVTEAMGWNLSWPVKAPLMIGAGLWGGILTSAAVNAVAQQASFAELIPRIFPKVTMAMMAAWSLYELATLSYWEWNYGVQYRALMLWKEQGEYALKELKNYTPALSEARNKIMASLVSYYLEPLDGQHTRIALKTCVSADSWYFASEAYNENLFAQESVKSLSDVLDVAYTKARNGTFSLELRDNGYSGMQNLRFDLMFCGNGTFQFVRSRSQDGEFQLYRLYKPELLVELVENLSLLTDLNQFRFHVTSMPFYASLIAPEKAFRVDGVIRSPNDEEKVEK